MLPAIVPIALALEDRLRIGRSYSLPTFDPATMTSTATAAFRINAESLFTLVDSARFDEDKAVWVNALTDTVRAWRVEQSGVKDGFSGWIDAQGRVVEAEQPGGLTLRRTAYELAFENWRIARDRATAANAGTGDILERTAIAAGAKVGRTRLRAMTVQLGAPRFTGYDLPGGRQTFSGDTLTVVQEKDSSIGAGMPSFRDMQTAAFKQRAHNDLGAEPLLQIHDGEIVMLAIKIIGLERNPREMVRKLNQWVSDSVADVATFSVPNAIGVARSRRGDCNEHTQLLIAMTRAIGVPTRFASGLLYVNGKFYYHAWAEVWLGEWVAVDPTFGQFPADAAHLRFVLGGLSRQTELLQPSGQPHDQSAGGEVIRLTQLSKKYRTLTAVERAINLHVARRAKSVWVRRAERRVGKTTTLRMIAGDPGSRRAARSRSRGSDAIAKDRSRRKSPKLWVHS